MSWWPAKWIRFGPFELDVERAELRKKGVRLRIHDQPFRILTALLENPGVTVSRQELIKRVWSSGTFVDFEHSLNAAVNRLRETLGDSVEHPRYIETVARRGYCFIGQAVTSPPASSRADEKTVSATETSESPGPSQAPQTVAVLPFVNLGPDRTDDYFSDGLAEELISALTKVPLLRVTARASSARFRDRTLSLKEIAERLRVSTVLDGSFRRSGDRIRVAAQLVNGADENCLWAEQYDRELGDLLDVQEGIARSIVGTLRLTVGSEQLIRRYTRNEDVHLFYLKGTFHMHKWGPDSMERLTDYMRRVVAIEPAYAPAWVELAHVALARVMTGCVPPAKVMPGGMEAAHRAISGDPDLAEAHGVLGLLEGIYEHKWAEALSEFRIALNLNPASPGVRYFHAMVLTGLGRVEEAISELHLSLEIDPFSVLACQHLCRLYTIRGDYVQAIAYGKQAVEVGPHHWPGFARLGEAYVYSGELGKGLTWMEQSRSIAPVERRYFTAGLAAAYCQAGKRIQAENLFSEAERRSSQQYVPCTLLGLIAAELGYLDRAFEYFRRALQDRDSFLFLVPTERSLTPIRNEARYAELVRALHVPFP